jgi:lipopolysaccharide assembly outer membrane protein LptD (OstA)
MTVLINRLKKLMNPGAAVMALLLMSAFNNAAAQQGAMAAVDINQTDIAETWRFPELQCGSLNASKLNTQIEEFSAAEINRVELDDERGSSSIVQVDADAIDFPDRNIVYLTGYTRLSQNGNRVTADELVYDKVSELVEARGMVQLSSTGGDIVQTSKLFYDIASQTARVDGDVRLITTNGDFINAQGMQYNLEGEAARSGPAEFLFANRDANSPVHVGEDRVINAYGRAEALEFIGQNNVMLYNVVVTTCLDNKPDLRFTADSMNVDLLNGNRKGVNSRVVVVDPSEYASYKSLLN